MPSVSFHDVTRVFPGGARALDRLNLTADDGEFVILLGPSGCGKTTALRLLAGLDKPTSGEIAIGNRVVNDIPPAERDIAMVFQNYALYPHMTIYRNLAFGLRERKIPKSERDRRVRDVSAMLGLSELLKRKPAQLSGGQRQRVAMGRALVREPKAFLLDEPLSNLDAQLRVEMRAGLRRLHQTLGITTLYVTHDQVEAMTLGDRIAVMSKGRVQQIGAPEDVYAHPATLFVAAFIGSPAMNLLTGTAAGGVVRTGDLALEVPGIPDGDVVVGFRPEHLRPASSPNGHNTLELLVDVVEPLGSETLVHGEAAGVTLAAVSDPLAAAPAAGAAPTTDAELIPPSRPLDAGARARLVVRLDAGDHPKVGERIPVTVQPGEAHVFDAATGEALR